MATNLAIDDKLIKEALKIGSHQTKKAVVTEALQEYIKQRKRKREFLSKIFNSCNFISFNS
ncbi:MAG: type II toxin-antitoxin system VapB family antitoxin [Candidatus Scalinduaceae bacterium]